MSIIRTRERDAASPRAPDDGDGAVADRRATRATTTTRPVGATTATVRERQREEFGGVSWLSTLVGWLAAAGLAAILTGILGAAGAVLAVSHVDSPLTDTDPETIGVAGGIALLVVLAIAYFFGGYAAGRMARFDGARQGIGVWLWTILAAVVVAALAAIGGSEYDIFQRLNLPRIAIGGDTLTAGGAITGAVAIIVTLLFAVIGGKVGERFHKRVDRVATDEFVVDR
jgi:amino acid transporter